MTPEDGRTKKIIRARRRRHFFIKLKRKSRLVYLRILRINDPPERIARGAALGVFMGILPTFGIGGVLAFVFAFAFRANKAASVLGTFIMNPLTSPFFWSLSIVVGSFILREDSSQIFARIKNDGLLHGIGWAGTVFMVGNIIIGVVFTVVSYYLLKRIIVRHREKKALKRMKRGLAAAAEEDTNGLNSP